MDGFIYLVEKDGFVKIGFTGDPETRIRQIGKGSSMPEGMTLGPVRPVAIFPGDKVLERELHDAFDEYRLWSEWFLIDGRLERFVAIFEGTPCTDCANAPDLIVCGCLDGLPGDGSCTDWVCRACGEEADGIEAFVTWKRWAVTANPLAA